MSIRNDQSFFATIEFNYSAPVFEEDPDDVYELAQLEKADLERSIKSVLQGLVQNPEDIAVSIMPIIGE